MLLVDSWTADPRQNMRISLEDGVIISVTLEYKENQQGWFMDIDSDVFTCHGRRLVSSPNLLRSFRGIIDFGIAVVTADGQDPAFKDDFTSGRVKFYTLNSEDVTEIEEKIQDAKTV